MALSRVKVWVSERLNSADLNAEFNNLLNNANSLISPFTANVAAGGFKLTGLAAGSAAGESVRYEQLGWTQLSTVSASASATIDITSGFSSTYDEYVIGIRNLLPATDNTALWVRISQSATFISGATDYSHVRHTVDTAGAVATAGSGAGDSKLILASALSNTASLSWSGWLHIYNPAGATFVKTFAWHAAYHITGPTVVSLTGSGAFVLNSTAIDGIRFLMSSGNITAGTFVLYGVRKT